MQETCTLGSLLMHRGDGDQSNPWALIRREDKFDCRYYIARRDVVTIQGGEERLYTHIHVKHLGVAVVPIDHDGTTTLVGQYRYVLDRYTWEIPKGGGSRDLPAARLGQAGTQRRDGFPRRSLAAALCRFPVPRAHRRRSHGVRGLGPSQRRSTSGS